MAKLQKLTPELIAQLESAGIKVQVAAPAEAKSLTAAPAPVRVEAAAPKVAKDYGTTATLKGTVLTLTVDLNTRSLYFDGEGQLRTDSKGRLRPYAGFSIEGPGGRPVFFGMSMPDLR